MGRHAMGSVHVVRVKSRHTAVSGETHEYVSLLLRPFTAAPLQPHHPAAEAPNEPVTIWLYNGNYLVIDARACPCNCKPNWLEIVLIAIARSRSLGKVGTT